MLVSFGLILCVGYICGLISSKLKLPSLVGMIFAGVLMGPSAFNIISSNVMDISSDIRAMALIIILIRCGLALDINKVKKVGVTAILLSFIPATIEIIAVVFLGVKILGLTLVEAFILGTVLAAVSPAVIIPRMLKIQKEGYGKERHIPELVMVASSMDDIFVIILFSTAIGLYFDFSVNVGDIVTVPLSVIIGGFFGYIMGRVFVFLFKKYTITDTNKIIFILSFSFIFYGSQDFFNEYIPISMLVSIIMVATVIYNYHRPLAIRLSEKFRKMWVVAEIFLFVLVGATVDLTVIVNNGGLAIIIIVIALIFRIITVAICLSNTKFNKKEKLFIGISYIPKATVQAAIGGIPLSMQVNNGNLILAVAVVAIIVTAPVGGFLIDRLYKKLLYTFE